MVNIEKQKEVQSLGFYNHLCTMPQPKDAWRSREIRLLPLHFHKLIPTYKKLGSEISQTDERLLGQIPN